MDSSKPSSCGIPVPTVRKPQYCVLQVGTTENPAIQTRISAIADKLAKKCFGNYKCRQSTNWKTGPSGMTQQHNVSNEFSNDDTSRCFAIATRQIDYVAAFESETEFDFSKLVNEFCELLDSLSDELNCLKTRSSGLRQIFQVSISDLPASEIAREYQGNHWGLDAKHVHTDFKTWQDVEDSLEGRINVHIKSTKKHGCVADNIANLQEMTRKFDSVSSNFGLTVDAYISAKDFRIPEPIDGKVKKHFDVQENEISKFLKTVFVETS